MFFVFETCIFEPTDLIIFSDNFRKVSCKTFNFKMKIHFIRLIFIYVFIVTVLVAVFFWTFEKDLLKAVILSPERPRLYN